MDKPEQKQDKLTPRRRKFVRNLVKGMSITDAALKAGYSPRCAAQLGSAALESIRIKMPEVLEQAGLTDSALIKKYLKPALRAQETKFAQVDGKFTDERKVPAWATRLSALDMVFNLKGSYAAKPQQNNTAVAIQVVVEHIGGTSSQVTAEAV